MTRLSIILFPVIRNLFHAGAGATKLRVYKMADTSERETRGRPVLKTRLYFNFITRDCLCNMVASAVRILIFSFRRYSLISNDCICYYVTPELCDIPLQFIGRSPAKFQPAITSFSVGAFRRQPMVATIDLATIPASINY